MRSLRFLGAVWRQVRRHASVVDGVTAAGLEPTTC